jgi:hypothetical protein
LLEKRLHDLLERNRETGLTPDEGEEMEKFLMISHLMTLEPIRKHEFV